MGPQILLGDLKLTKVPTDHTISDLFLAAK